MKIDLTKEEWEFLKDQMNSDLKHHYEMQEAEYPGAVCYIDVYGDLFESILEKLGSEWFDDETPKIDTEKLEEFHDKIFKICAERGITLKQYLTDLIRKDLFNNSL